MSCAWTVTITAMSLGRFKDKLYRTIGFNFEECFENSGGSYILLHRFIN
jgi:hypothetical protein